MMNEDRFSVRVPAVDRVSMTLAQEERQRTFAIVDQRRGEICHVRDLHLALMVVNLLNANVCGGRGA